MRRHLACGSALCALEPEELGRIAVSRLDVLRGSTEMLAALVVGMSYLLLLSTVVSIIDRAVAPLRANRVSG